MEHIKPDARLSAVADMVCGDFLCDVGTDHAILPVYLCLAGKIRRAVASDIRKGPLEAARRNISSCGLSDKIETVLSDGLLSLGGYSPTDIAIAGMGGILITKILGASELSKKAHLVLQPMTHAHTLRLYLTQNGYEITGEALAADGDKIYQIISAVFTGNNTEYTPLELYLGKLNIENRDKYPGLFSAHLKCAVYTWQKKLALGGDTAAGELISAAQQLLKGE